MKNVLVISKSLLMIIYCIQKATVENWGWLNGAGIERTPLDVIQGMLGVRRLINFSPRRKDGRRRSVRMWIWYRINEH
jgi:hypothetical protein